MPPRMGHGVDRVISAPQSQTGLVVSECNMKQSAEVIIAGPCAVDQWAGQHAPFQPFSTRPWGCISSVGSECPVEWGREPRLKYE